MIKYRVNEYLYGTMQRIKVAQRIRVVEIEKETEAFVFLPADGHNRARREKKDWYFDSFADAKQAWVKRCADGVESAKRRHDSAMRELAEAMALSEPPSESKL